jgi:hypothetical protein
LVLDPEENEAVAARFPTAADYVAEAGIEAASLTGTASAGLGAYGNRANVAALTLSGRKLTLWLREKGQQQVIASFDAPESRLVHIRMTARGGSRFSFAFRGDDQSWKEAGANLSGDDLPPWDLATRIALIAAGGPARFESFRIYREVNR